MNTLALALLDSYHVRVDVDNNNALASNLDNIRATLNDPGRDNMDLLTQIFAMAYLSAAAEDEVVLWAYEHNTPQILQHMRAAFERMYPVFTPAHRCTDTGSVPQAV